MRSEKEMLDLIIKTAEEDPRVRAAYLEGSRVNPNVPFVRTGNGLTDSGNGCLCNIRKIAYISVLMWKTVMAG